jgi:hypothetical protein
MYAKFQRGYGRSRLVNRYAAGHQLGRDFRTDQSGNMRAEKQRFSNGSAWLAIENCQNG